MTESEILTELRKLAGVQSIQAAAFLGLIETASPERKPALLQQAQQFLQERRVVTVGPTEFKGDGSYTLFGFPVIEVDNLTVVNPGDIVLGDWSGYLDE